jgi:hypothetical protein
MGEEEVKRKTEKKRKKLLDFITKGSKDESNDSKSLLIDSESIKQNGK